MSEMTVDEIAPDVFHIGKDGIILRSLMLANISLALMPIPA